MMYKKGDQIEFQYDDIEHPGQKIQTTATVISDGNVFDGILKGTDSVLPYALDIEYERKYFSNERGFYFSMNTDRIYDLKDIVNA